MATGRRLAATLAAALLAAPGAQASCRLRVEAMEYPWSAAGRINAAGHSYCTGFLIGERHLLTAAHCLWNRAESRWWPAAAIHFVAGYQGGQATLSSQLKSYVVADGFAFAGHPVAEQADADWALGELAEPLGQQAGWLGSLAAAGRPAVMGQLGYRAESRHAMSLDYGCVLLGRDPSGRILWNDCPAVHGDSGGPVIAFTTQGPRLVGLTVVSARVGRRPATGLIDLTVLTDVKRFPIAARAVIKAGLGVHPGHPPAAGSPVSATPAETVARLGRPAGKDPFAALAAGLAAGCDK